MNPEFGSGLWSVLFENITDDLKPIIESTIRKDISNWLNYITVQSVDVQYNTDNNYNRVSVSVKYVAASAGIYDQQVLNVQMITNNI
jgi:phage baseplate assembly protein W